jgi:hypothetical protein
MQLSTARDGDTKRISSLISDTELQTKELINEAPLSRVGEGLGERSVLDGEDTTWYELKKFFPSLTFLFLISCPVIYP